MKTLALLSFAAGVLAATSINAANWPGWRNDGSGICSEASVPIRWSGTNNIVWKSPLPERGNSSPIVWEDKVFLTQADGNRRTLMAFQRRDGKLLWQAGPAFNEPDPTHQANPFCSSTPVTDGERVIAWFGSAGLYCYDTKGTELWHRDLGKLTHEWGYGSSPVLNGDLCLLHFGPGKRTFLAALNKKTGETVWQVDTPEIEPAERFDGFAGKQGQPIGSWSTPLILKTAKREEALLSSVGTLKSFDPKTGKELWKSDGLNPLIYASPIAG